MLNRTKKKLYEMTDTLAEATAFLADADADAASAVLNTILEFVDAMDGAISDAGLPVPAAGADVEAYRAVIDAAPTEYKVVFLPYYDNTWDALESVYEAFAKDPMFVTEIVIIPIQRNTPTGTAFVYSDYLTPAGIPNTHYNDYDFAADEPDFVFYNQPYDLLNINKYRSENIKKYAGCMVYVPYYLTGNYQFDKALTRKRLESASMLPGHVNADIYIAQSEAFKRQLWGTPVYSRLIALGNPKTDAIYRTINSGARNSAWDEKLAGKTVLFVNSHYFWTTSEGAWLRQLAALFDYAEQADGVALLWRPHPQSFLMVRNRSDPLALLFLRMAERCGESRNLILDETADVNTALFYSDIIISAESSIIPQAILYDKPMYLCASTPVQRSRELSIPDLAPREAPEEGFPDKIRAMVEARRAGIDPYAPLRRQYIEEQYMNVGVCGEKLLGYIKEQLAAGGAAQAKMEWGRRA
jgi:hypothetical protein